MKADREVYSIIRQGNNDPRWKVDHPRIIPDSASRMFDPFCPDCEPMPGDDPTAHQKMHCVAGMQGAPDWHDNGQTSSVDSPYWRQSLLINEKGEIPLDKEQAVELSILHSPEYQSALENLYLTAMRVSQERFRYDVQFYGGDSLLWDRRNRATSTRAATTLQNDVNLRAEKLLATGGEWVVGLANSVTWSFSGRHSWETSSLLNASLVQPLLRGASRKVVLESLTQSERNFLAAVRQMVFYQQGHYTRIVTGQGGKSIPSVPSGSSAANFPSVSGGFYGLLAEQIRIQNQRQNIIASEENLNRFIELFDAGQVDNISRVEETRQSLLNSQSSLLTRINTYQGNVETFVRTLGLPPDLEVNISDPLLEQFQLTSPTLTTLQEDVAELLAMIRKKAQPIPEHFREEIKNIVRRTEGEIVILGQDLEMLQKSMPARLAGLKNLETFLAGRIESGERIDTSIYDTKDFEKRVDDLRTKDAPKTLRRLRAAFTLLNLIANLEEPALRTMIQDHTFDSSALAALEELKLNKITEANTDSTDSEAWDALPQQPEPEQTTDALKSLQDIFSVEAPKPPMSEARKIIAELRQRDEYRDWIRRVFSLFQYELVSLSLVQTRARLDAMTLVPVSVTPEEAFQTASENRLDWMNQKSQLVDTWRQIDITADRLKGDLDLTLKGELGTINSQHGTSTDNGRLQVGVAWTSPLTRHTEMMNYRRSQIAYQNARRNYYTYVDGVQAELRNNLRNVRMRQIDFEISRKAVLVGTIRVDVMQLQMEQPSRRGTAIDTNLSTNLINALNGLMNSQNAFLDTWVAYQTQRMLLDLNMGTMQLDSRGHWIDPGVIESETAAPTLPKMLPLPLLNIETPKLNRRYIEE